MFATLDPKLKQLQLPSRRKILLSDTVGFIRNLPHTLVTSFRATLEEVERAELLLHVRDASSPMLEEQKVEVEKVLGELDVEGKTVLEVMNKIDLVSAAEREGLAAEGQGVGLGTDRREGLEELLQAIDEHLIADPVIEREFRLPQSEGAVLAALEAGAVLGGKTVQGKSGVPGGEGAGVAVEPVPEVPDRSFGRRTRGVLTSIGRLMGSGGGVPDHATYVTQKIGSGWWLKFTIFPGESQREFRLSGDREVGSMNAHSFVYRPFSGLTLSANPLLKLGVPQSTNRLLPGNASTNYACLNG